MVEILLSVREPESLASVSALLRGSHDHSLINLNQTNKVGKQ